MLNYVEFAIDPIGLFFDKLFDLSAGVEFRGGNHQAFLRVDGESHISTAPGFFELVGDGLVF